MSSSAVAIFVVTLAVVMRPVSTAPDMFTALVDMQRALRDEASASELLRQYVTAERMRLDQLERY